MRTTLILAFALFFATIVTAQEVCDDGSLNTTSCNPCAIQQNIDTCQAISRFHECSATNCDGACSFECQCRVMCPAIFVDCEPACGPGFRCQRAPCSCAQVCVPVKQCTYEGKTFEDGETFTDHCNECSCNDGVVGCTKKGCPEPTCPKGQTFTRVCPNGCALIDCMEGSDCVADHCNNCEAKCKPTFCMVKGKKINNGMPFIDGCRHCICEDGVASCSKPDPKCVRPTCPRGHKFEQVCEDKCAFVRIKCAEPDVIGCQIDQCHNCTLATCTPRPCTTMADCDSDLGQVCYYKNPSDKSVAGVCRTFERCTKQNKCAPGSTPAINKTNKKCYCIPSQVTTNALEFDSIDVDTPRASSAAMTSTSTVVALVAAAAAML